eukprot:Selendium_serpulae@DN3583_c0_g1_i1.p1
MVTDARMCEALLTFCTEKPNVATSGVPAMTVSQEMRHIILHSKHPATRSIVKGFSVQDALQGPCSVLSPELEQHQRYITRSFRTPRIRLEPAQERCVLSALTNRLTLIQGPPGTGKTYTACAIIEAWTRLDSSKRIFVVAESNVAADNIASLLKGKDIHCVRFGGGTELSPQSLMQGSPQLGEYQRLTEMGHTQDAKRLLTQLTRSRCLRDKVVVATNIGCGNQLFQGSSFQHVLVDESSQSIEPSSLVPLCHNASRLVLIGDTNQLGPSISGMGPDVVDLRNSLFERLIASNSAEAIMLDVQRRMHPTISHFPNNHFYRGLIRDADVDDQRRPPLEGFPWPSLMRVAFVDTSALNALESQTCSTSKSNRDEAKILIKILAPMLNTGTVIPRDVGVITPYHGQRTLIRHMMSDSFETPVARHVEVDTVDGFQGKEKDLILFSAVRSNASGSIGFLQDFRRMNVMLTRARRGLIIVGDSRTLANESENWKPWLDWMMACRCIVPGGAFRHQYF